MKHLFLVISFQLCLCSVNIAQKTKISGYISCNSNPIEFANVAVFGSTYGSFSDTNGYYQINSVPFGKYQLAVSIIGYKTKYIMIEISSIKPDVSIDFILEENSFKLDEIVVSGTLKEVSRLESPVSVEVFTAAFFKANPAPSIFESLQNVNGVRPQLNCNICNTGDIHINGLEGPYTMVLIDGMPIVSGLSTVYGLSGIPQSLIERVEIVKGPASTLYGSEAVGGLINIITKNPINAPLLAADLFTTSWGELNSDIALKFSTGKKAQSLLGINYFVYQNPIDNNNDGFSDVTLQNRISVFNKWNFYRKYNRVFTVAARYNYENRWGGEMLWTPEYRGGNILYGESIYTSRWETFGVYQLPVSEMINFQFSANGHHHNSYYGTTSYNAEQFIGFGQLTWNKEIGPRHDLLIGAALRYTYYDDNTPATSEINTINKPSVIYLPGMFIQDEIIIDEQNKLLLGIRYDYNSVHATIFSPRINYKWSSKNKLNVIRFGIGNGYRVANVFTEDHAALTGARDVVFTEDLLPETSWNTNINFVKKIFTRKNSYIGIDASIFYTYFNNRIIPDYESDPNKIIYSNLDGSAVSKGISLNLEVSMKNGLKFLAGATFMDVSISENNVNTRQLLTENFSGVWNIAYTIPNSGFSIDYTGNLYGPMRLPLLGELDDRSEYSPWWSIQNIQVTKHFKKNFELYFGVKNILNYVPPANSIARSFDPFDQNVEFGDDGQVIPTPDNPNALSFDPSYVFAPNQGVRFFIGFRYILN